MSQFVANEQSSGRYSATVTDESKSPLPASSLTTLMLTLYDVDTGTIINRRDGQDVLNANDVTVDGDGNLIWSMKAEDSIIVDADAHPVGEKEKHIALFRWTYNGGYDAGEHEFIHYVKNIGKVAA